MAREKKGPSPLRMILILTAVAIVFAALLAAVNQLAGPTIERNARAKLYKGVLTVLGFPTAGDYEARFREQIKVVQKGGMTIYEGYRDGELVGYAFRASGGGFQGIVDLVVGLSPDLEEVLGIEVLECGDTPGLGGRILEPWFKEQFKGLKTKPQIEFVKYVKPERPNEFEAVTGATFTSIAVRDILNENIARLREILKEVP